MIEATDLPCWLNSDDKEVATARLKARFVVYSNYKSRVDPSSYLYFSEGILMASGRNHDRAITVTTPVLMAAAIASGHADVGLITTASYYLAGMYLSPSLDLVSRPYKRWGFLRWLWLPYQKFIPRHRHWLSHGPVIGSGVRLLYLATWLSPLWVLFPGLQRVQWVGVTLPNVVAFLVGVELSALNHLLLDGLLIPLPKSLKRRLKGG